MSERLARGATDEPLIGATINGRYRILSLIARGGMGKVFKAEQSALGRVCALKVLSPKYEGDQDPEFHRRFSLEAATVSKLSHPNTVTIFDHGKCDQHGVYFIAMEYLDGRTLHQVLHRERWLPELRANRIAQQICRSVAEAHTRGVVHRDLKPGNVMLLQRDDELDVVKVLDFGLVKDVTGEHEDLTQTGLFMGSPKYMSPEQITGGDISPRSDVYALGVILYEMLTGRVPFERKASMNTLMAHVHERPPPLVEANPEAVISPAMDAVVMRCLEKDAQKRFASMRDLQIALKRIAGDITGTFESLPQVNLPEPPTLSVPPPSGSGSSRASSTMVALGPIDSLSPPSPTVTGPLPRPRSSSLRTYAIAIAAALFGGGVALVAARRYAPPPSAPTVLVTSVMVPTSMPAPASETASMSGLLRAVRVESEPAGAMVSDRGTELCMATPCEFVLRGEAAKLEHRLTLIKRGFRVASVIVSPMDEKVTAKLDAAPAEWPPPSADSDAKLSSAGPSAVPSSPYAATAEPAVVSAARLPSVVAAEQPTAAPAAAPPGVAEPAVMRFEEGMSRPVMISGRVPVYTREALQARVQGTVIAKCIITTSGSLSGCRIVKGLPHMDEAVLAALATQRYQPIVYQGRPVNVDYVFTMKMVPP